VLLQGGILAAGIATQGSEYSNIAQLGSSIGAQLISTKYGRDAERESDHYGMIYMSRAGYDPQGAVDLQRTFVKLAEGRRQDFLSGMFSSHPPSAERVQNNITDAAALPKGGELGKARYQNMILRLIETKPAYDAYEEAQQALVADNSAKASSLIKKAIAIEPQEAHFFSLLGDIEHKGDRLKVAQGHYAKAIKLNDNYFHYHLQQGLVSEKLGDSPGARHHLQRSLQLLPTANAYNALGNVSRSAGQLAQAKGYYAKAAVHKSPAGQAALGSLLELDLPSNPGNYIKARYGLAQDTSIQIAITNTTPRDIAEIVILLQYPDKQGRLRQIKRQISGRLPAGKSRIIKTQIKVDPELATSVKTTVVHARLANE